MLTAGQWSFRTVIVMCDDLDLLTLMFHFFSHFSMMFNPLTPNDLQRRCAVSPLKIKIPSKNMLEKPTNSPFIHSVY
jgi:hypothetical protein